MSLPVLAVDMDEVLAQFALGLSAFHNVVYATSLTPASFHSYQFHEVWGGTVEETNQKMEDFFESSYFKETLEPIPTAFPVLQRLKERFSLQIVTARQSRLNTLTSAWIDRYFPNTFEAIHFGNHFSKPGEKARSKAEICREINAVMLIDDSLTYNLQCAKHGLPTLLFGDYGWNQAANRGLDEWNVVSIVDVVEDAHIIQHTEQERTLLRAPSWNAVERAINVLYTRLVSSGINGHSTDGTVSDKGGKGSSELVVAAVQMTSINNLAHNLEIIHNIIRVILDKHPDADLICLPECALFMGLTADETLAQSTTIDPSTTAIQALSHIAREMHIWISVGGFPETTVSSSGEKKMFNAHFLIDRGGLVQQPIYRKLHLFDCPFVQLQESRCTEPGGHLSMITIDGWNIGLSVCYDLRFPELYQALRHRQGQEADVILVPAAFTVPTGQAHWEILLRARAIENQCYVIAAAQAGQHNEKRRSYGNTMIVDPWGKVEGRLGDDETGYFVSRLRKVDLELTRAKMPVKDHRKPTHVFESFGEASSEK